jgi:hypothetical protein
MIKVQKAEDNVIDSSTLATFEILMDSSDEVLSQWPEVPSARGETNSFARFTARIPLPVLFRCRQNSRIRLIIQSAGVCCIYTYESST